MYNLVSNTTGRNVYEQQVRQALAKAAAHGIFGYSATDQDYDEAVCQWISRHFGWDIRPEWLVKTPGIVFAIALAIRAFTKEGEGVLIQQPVYYPFGDKIRENGRRVEIGRASCRERV